MDSDNRVEPRGGLEADREHAIGHARKIVDAAVAHEGFEAYDTALVQGLEMLEVVGDESAPETKVNQCLL